jgi:hypothetical protein
MGKNVYKKKTTPERQRKELLNRKVEIETHHKRKSLDKQP